MPSYKKPNTLENICLKAAANLVIKACDANDDERKSGNAVELLQEYLLLKIRPLFDELCQVVVEMYFCRDAQNSGNLLQKHYLKDFRSLLSVISCEQTKTLTLNRIPQCANLNILNSDRFFKNQISKLENIVKLNIPHLIITDEIFDEISRVCKNVCDISLMSNLEFSSKDSVLKLLECKKLQILKIEFVKWNDKREIIVCIQRFVQSLSNLRHIHFDEMGTVLLDERMTTSLWSLTEKCINAKSLRNIILLCPCLIELKIDAHFSTQQEKDNMLTTLAESSLHLLSLELRHFSFTQNMTRFLKLKGNDLLKLTLGLSAGTITYNDICTVGANCLNLEQLEIIEFFAVVSLNCFGVPKVQIQTTKIPPRLFLNLKCLVLTGDSKCDQRIVSLLMSNAKNLESISLTNVFAKNLDAITEMLNLNQLSDLQSFKLISERYGNEMAVPVFDKRSIQRLVDSCSKLMTLELVCVFEDDAIQYLEYLERRIRGENLDLKLLYKPVKCGLNICEVGAHGDYILYEEY